MTTTVESSRAALIAKLTGGTSTSAKSTSNSMGEEFMALLLTQLRNQNPMEPMDNNQFVSQMTQMNSLMQLEKMNSFLELMELSGRFSSASNLVGKEVKYTNKAGQEATGLVSSMSFKGNYVTLMVGGVEVPFENVLGVAMPTSTTPSISAPGQSTVGEPVTPTTAV